MRSAELLPKCGHSFCAPCIAKLPGACPLCRVPFEPGSAIPNWSLRELDPAPPLSTTAATAALPSSKGLQGDKLLETSGATEFATPLAPPLELVSPVQHARPHLPATMSTPEPPPPHLPATVRMPPTPPPATALAPEPPPETVSTQAHDEERIAGSAFDATNSAHMRGALEVCRKLVNDGGLQALMDHFRKGNCDLFDEATDENKLEYTTCAAGSRSAGLLRVRGVSAPFPVSANPEALGSRPAVVFMRSMSCSSTLSLQEVSTRGSVPTLIWLPS